MVISNDRKKALWIKKQTKVEDILMLTTNKKLNCESHDNYMRNRYKQSHRVAT